MRAAEHVDHAPGHDAVPLLPERSHPTPVYAARPARRRTSARPADTSLRGWPAQLAQWALVFGVLGLLIGGVKWWDRHRGTEPPAPATVTATEAPGPGQASTTAAASRLAAGRRTGRETSPSSDR
jgi:negative regulator of sigma E activity